MVYKLSPHTLNLYSECRRCFWSCINEKKSRPSGPFPSLPGGMDLVIKKYFDLYRVKQELPPEVEELSGVKLFDDSDALNTWRNQWKGLVWKNPAGHLLHGALDEVLQVDDGELVVMDYKTRGFPLKKAPDYYTLQMEVYNALLRKNGFKTKDYAYLLFFYPREFTREGAVAFNKQLIKVSTSVAHAEQVFKEAIMLLDGQKPERSGNCVFCQWVGD